MPRYSREYSDGYQDGYEDCIREVTMQQRRRAREPYQRTRRKTTRKRSPARSKPRKLSSWQKYIKNKRNHIKFKSGSNKGKLNLKAMAVKFRKTPAGRKKKK